MAVMGVVMKPHKGVIKNWKKHYYSPEQAATYKSIYCEEPVFGYIIYGMCIDHPKFGTSKFFTSSFVVCHDLETGEIETKNSMYTLEGLESTE